MKVLFLDQYGDLGGAQQCLLALLPALERKGWQAVVAAPGSGAMLDSAAEFGAVTEPLPMSQYSTGRKSIGDVGRFLRATPGLSRTIRALIERHAPALVYINGPRMLPAAAWGGPLPCPVIFHSHHYLGKRYATELAGRAIRRLNASVIACCDFVAAQWRPYREDSRIHTVYNGVPDLRGQRRLAGGAKTIGIVGRIAPEKGQLIFVEAAKRVEAARKLAAFPDVRFEIIGEALFGDRKAEAYRKLVEKATEGLPVRFTGWVADPFETFGGMDLLVVASTVPEATTRVIPEAWSAGVPVIAPAVGGIAEIVKDGVNGFLVAQATAESIAARVGDVLALSPGSIGAVIAAGRDTFESQFTVDRYCRRILEICERA